MKRNFKINAAGTVALVSAVLFGSTLSAQAPGKAWVWYPNGLYVPGYDYNFGSPYPVTKLGTGYYQITVPGFSSAGILHGVNPTLVLPGAK